MRLCMQKTSRHCYVCVAQCCSRRSWALPVVATTTKTTTWPQMWLEMKQAKRRKLLNMSESKHAKTGKSRTQRSVERLAVLPAASTPTISKLLHRHSCTKPMEITNLIEGSLEVKLPTIWTDEKQSREEAERRERLEERRVEDKE